MVLARAQFAHLKDWFINDVLPVWISHGYDHAHGGFYESLGFDAAPITGQPRRVRVQTRQIHTFTQAGLRGWHPGAEELAAKGFDHFLNTACPEGGARGCVHLLDDDGSTLDDRRDLYDQAFLLLACAARWEAAKDERALTLANNTIAFLNTELRAPQGGWHESNKRELPRRQNPHMHLFEAFMALYAATNDATFLKQAESVLELFKNKFYDADQNILREYFDEQLFPDPKLGGEIEPGHMAEWVWLLGKYASLAEETQLEIMQSLYAQTLNWTSRSSPFLPDNVSLSGNAVKNTYRLWPQTERLKAALVLTKYNGAPLVAEAGKIVEAIFKSYINQTTPGLWRDQIDQNGKVIVNDVPASILYHLYEAVNETVKYTERMEAS